MKLFPVASLFLLLLTIRAFAQQPPFSLVPTTLPQLSYSACAWCDYDHDGDLDLALMGAEGNDPLTKIFRNDNGSFTDIQANLLSLHFGSIQWGDYNNDGDQDLLVTGIESQGTAHTIIYNNVNGVFTGSGIALPGVMDGQACWGDLDNDGNLDILLAGSGMSAIFRNDGNGQFTTVNAPLPAVTTAMCCWNDYNNDGQSDLLVCGDTGGGIVSKLYRNNHGMFTEVIITPEPFTGLYGGQAKFADLDNDGDQDLVITGMDLYVDGYFLLYRNDGNDHFTKFAENTANLLNPTFDMGDYDADGLPDIILMGTISGCGGAAVTILMQNLGFISFFNVSSLLPGYKLGEVAWADYNNDGLTDLLFTGLDAYDAPKTQLYLNNLGNPTTFNINTPPSPPQGVSVSTEPGITKLQWNSSTDTQTPKEALTYNIRIGTLPDSYEILAPLAVLYTGARTITAPGNASADTNWMISGLPGGTYFFSVQAIDNGFMPGAFSSAVMFTSQTVGMVDQADQCNIGPNPFTDKLYIRVAGNPAKTGEAEKNNVSVLIMNSTGQIQYRGEHTNELNVSSWPSGVYLLQARKGDAVFTRKLIKE